MLYGRKISGRVLLSILLAAMTCGACAKKEKERVWTSADGRTLKGELKEQGDDWVKLLIKGRVHKIKLEKLSKKDREFIKNMVKPLEVKVEIKSWVDQSLDLNMKTMNLDLKNVEKGKELYCLMVWVGALKTGGGSTIKSTVEAFFREDGKHKYEAGFLNHSEIGEIYRGYALRIYNEEGQVIAERSSSGAAAKFLDKARPRYKPEPKKPKKAKSEGAEKK